MRFKKTFFTLTSLIVCIVPVLGSVFSLNSSNNFPINSNNTNVLSTSSNAVPKLTGRPTTVRNRIIVPSQNTNFAQSYLDWEYFANLSSSVVNKLKQLLLDNAFQSLPSSVTTADIDIKNGYVDNYAGIIMVNFDLKKYYDNSGNLAPNVNINTFLNDSISLSGFRTSNSTNIPNQIITNLTDNIENVNTSQLTPLVQNNLINGIPSSQITLDSNSLIRYPGLKKITYDVSIDRYLVDAYIDEENFEVNLVPKDGYKKFGYYCSMSSPVTGTTAALTKNDVSFYGDFLSTGTTTYVNEGNFLVPNEYINQKASDVFQFADDVIVNNILNKLNILINPFLANNASQIVINNKQFNDLTGTLILETKLTNNVFYQGNTYDYSQSNQPGSTRKFYLNITGFTTVKATTISPSVNITNINVSNITLSDRLASQFVNTTNNQDLLIEAFRILQNSGTNALFGGIPSNSLLPPPNTDWFSNQNISFDSHSRIGNNLVYVGVPNDITGELKITININWYFDPINGAFIISTRTPLKLTTTLTGFRTTNSDFAKINSRVAMRDVSTVLPQNAFVANPPEYYQDYILNPSNNAITNSSNILPGASIKISEKNKVDSWNDPESTNRTGNLMLHYEYQNFVDPVDGILNSNPSPGKILLGNFLNVLPTELNDNVTLDFFSLSNARFVTWVTNAGSEELSLKAMESLFTIYRPGRDDFPNIGNLFSQNNSNNSIPTAISSWYQDPNSFPLLKFSDFFQVNSIIDADVKNGSLVAEISLKTFYENDEKATLIDNQTNPTGKFLTKQITFFGFSPSKPTDVNYLINIRNAVINPNDYNYYPSDLENNITLLKEIIFRNSALFFRNIPDRFTINNFDVSNIVANNTDGSIVCTITIKNNYFDANSDFQANGPSIVFDKITINGFLTALPTEANLLVNISSLFFNNELLSEGTQLEKFEEMTIDGEATGNYVNNITHLIKNNSTAFLINPYDIEKIVTDSQYFLVSNPIANYRTGRLSFSLQLNYYFDDDAIPVSPNNPAPTPKTYNINLSGFAINQSTSSVSRFSLEQYPEIGQYAPQYLFENSKVLKDYIFGNKIANKNPNFTILNLLFRDLPYKWTQENNNVVNDKYYTEENSSIVSISPNATQGSATVTFKLTNVFVSSNNNILIGEADFTIIFEGLNKISATEIDPTWDLNSLTTEWGVNNSPADQKISTMDSNAIELWLNTQIFGNDRRYESFINNLVTSPPTSVSTVSLGGSIISINAKTGSVIVEVNVTNFYNADGTINGGTMNKEVTISGFATENSTFVKTRSTSIHESLDISSNILFNSTRKLPSEFISSTPNVNDVLKTNINNANLPMIGNPQLPNPNPLVNIMSLLFDNIVATTEISTINITGFDDIAGSISFRASIKNYYNENGILVTNTPSNEFPNEFTISGLYNANPSNISQSSVFINDISSKGVFGQTGDLNHLTPKEFLDNYNNLLVQNTTNFERAIALGIASGGNAYYPFAIPSNASFKGLSSEIFNNRYNTVGALRAKVDTNSYNIDEKEGILTFSVSFANIWTQENKEVTINGTTNTIMGQTLNVVTDGIDTVTKQLSITGFQQSNILDNSLIIASIVVGSVGLIAIFAIAIYFLVSKIRTYKG